MNNYINFLRWSSKNNNILLQFKKTPGNLNKYIEFIKESCKNIHIKKNIKKLEKIIRKTDNISKNLKMTIIEVSNLI